MANLQKVIYVIISGEEKYEGKYKSFDLASKAAKELCDNGTEDVTILEVGNAWITYLPDEPEPEIEPIKLSEL